MFTDEGEVAEAIVGALKLALHSLEFAFLIVSVLELRLARNKDGKGTSMEVGTFDIFALLWLPENSGHNMVDKSSCANAGEIIILSSTPRSIKLLSFMKSIRDSSAYA